MRWVAWIGGGVLALLLLAVAGVWLLLGRFDLGPLAARRATAALGRPVTIGALHVTPGRWVRVSVENAALANAPGGTRPEMAKLATATAELALWPLLHGTVVIRTATVDGLDVLLERIEGKGPNWHLHPEPPHNGEKPHRDGDFPDLRSLTVTGVITDRTSSGTDLPVGLRGVTFTAPSPDAPITLSGPASYKGVPVQVKVDGGSIAQYRNAAEPFPATVDLLADGQTHLRFQGTFVDPLNVDGAAGTLLLEAPIPATLFRIAGVDSTISPAVRLEGPFTHAGNDWDLSRLRGALGAAAISDGDLHLIEGVRATETAPLSPDRLGVALQVAHLDVDALLGQQKQSGGGGGDDLSLEVDPHPSMLLAARLRAADLTLRGIRFSDVALQASQTPGKVDLEALSVTYLGGRLVAQGAVQAGPDGSRTAAELRATGLELAALRPLLGMAGLPVTGRLDARATLTAAGNSVEAALPNARADAVLTMSGGSVSREIVQLGSTDISALFGKAEGTTAISCALAVLDLRGGTATVSPLRLRTASGTIAAHGTVDVSRRRLDLTVSSEPDTTAATALDIPVHVSGPFNDPSFAPAAFSGAGRAQSRAPDDTSRLPPELRAAARASPCLGR